MKQSHLEILRKKTGINKIVNRLKKKFNIGTAIESAVVKEVLKDRERTYTNLLKIAKLRATKGEEFGIIRICDLEYSIAMLKGKPLTAEPIEERISTGEGK